MTIKDFALLCGCNPKTLRYGTILLGLLIEKNSDISRNISINVMDSDDGENHFWMLRRKD